jgi:hypothetical protein
MLWVSAILDVDRRQIVVAACGCARLALHRVAEGEQRPRLAIEAAEAWANGRATLSKVRAAAVAAASAAAAAAAAYAAYAAAADAADAAYAAYAAAAAYAAYAAAAAAADAAYAAYAAASAAAYAAARAETLARCAGIVRRAIPYAAIAAAIAKRRAA